MVTVPGQELHPEVKSIKIVTGKGCLEEVAQLKVIAHGLQFLGSVADSEITDKYAPLLHRTVCNSPEFSKLGIPQVLHTKPYACAQNSQNQPERASSWPKQKQAQQSEKSRHSVQNDHNLALRHPAREKFVMDVV